MHFTDQQLRREKLSEISKTEESLSVLCSTITEALCDSRIAMRISTEISHLAAGQVRS